MADDKGQPMTPHQHAAAVLHELFRTIALVDIWSYNSAGLVKMESRLSEKARKMASEGGLSDEDAATASKVCSMMFWRWIGMREGWEAKERDGDNPHQVFPYDVTASEPVEA